MTLASTTGATVLPFRDAAPRRPIDVEAVYAAPRVASHASARGDDNVVSLAAFSRRAASRRRFARIGPPPGGEAA